MRVNRDISDIFLEKCTLLPPISVLNKFIAVASLIFLTRENLAVAANLVKFLHLLVQKKNKVVQPTNRIIAQNAVFDLQHLSQAQVTRSCFTVILEIFNALVY